MSLSGRIRCTSQQGRVREICVVLERQYLHQVGECKRHSGVECIRVLFELDRVLRGTS